MCHAARHWHHVSGKVCSAACIFCCLTCLLAAAAAAAADAPHAQQQHRSNRSREHLDRLLRKYGDGASGGSSSAGLSLDGLHRLLGKIGLTPPATDDGGNSSDAAVPHGHEGHEHHEDEADCPSAKEMHGWYHPADTQRDLTESEFQDLCPTLVHLLDSGTCRPGDRKKTPPSDKADKPLPQYWRIWSGDPHVLKVWGASLLAVTVTSLGGVATIFLIRPLMRTRFYTLVVQFLIALAVGSLSGDAFLHLLPHALFPDKADDHSHDEGDDGEKHMRILYRCLTALIGIYCFFVIERVTVLCQNSRHRRRNGDRRPQTNSSNVGEKLCNPFHRSYANLPTGTGQQDATALCHVEDMTVEFLGPPCGGSDGTNNGDCLLHPPCQQPCQQQQPEKNHNNHQHNNHQHEHNDHQQKASNTAAPADCDQSELTTHLSTPLHPQKQHQTSEADASAAAPDAASSRSPCGVTFDEAAVVVNGGDDEEHGHGHHSHHGHSHSHTTVRALAWTVIIGDGLHNFCDGMALGAAFAASGSDLSSGMSTAVAVFCHELPHELGDFAVLLQAGMSVRMALLANLVSSVVCLFGMVAGVLLVQGATQWVFMVTAGMFLYIALVDMMPELTTEKSSRGPGPVSVFLWQNAGFFIGAGIMFLISLYEHGVIKL